MAKGRKLTTSRSERFLGGFGTYYNNQSHENVNNGASELREDEVWSMVDDAVNGGDNYHAANGEWSSRASAEFNSSYRTRRPPPRTDRRQIGGLSLAFHDSSSDSQSPRIVHQYRAQDGGASAESPRGHHVAASAPVNVPDWSKIYRVDSVESLPDSDDGLNDYEPERVPPHEYLARSRRMAANSVFEGVGRTLKGRDLSRVRDAVWSQTGFDG